MHTQSPFPVPIVVALAAVILVALPGPQDDSYRAMLAPAAQRPACNTCGVVEIVREVARRAGDTGAAAPEGRTSESVLGYRMGGGGGEGFVLLLGAMAGGLPAAPERIHEVDVRFEDGSLRTFRYASEPIWRLGDRVRVIQGRIARLA